MGIDRFGLETEYYEDNSYSTMAEDWDGKWVRFEDYDAAMGRAIDIIAKLLSGYPSETIPLAEYEETDSMAEAFLAEFTRD